VDRREPDNQRRSRRSGGAGPFGREFLGERVGRRKQQGEEPGLTAGEPTCSRERAAVLYAENRTVEGDRNVAALAAADTREERQTGQSQADPQEACERCRRGKSSRLESRQEPRGHRGPCRCSPLVLHVRQPQLLALNIDHLPLGGRPPSEGAGLRRTARGKRHNPLSPGSRRRSEGVDLRSQSLGGGIL